MSTQIRNFTRDRFVLHRGDIFISFVEMDIGVGRFIVRFSRDKDKRIFLTLWKEFKGEMEPGELGLDCLSTLIQWALEEGL